MSQIPQHVLKGKVIINSNVFSTVHQTLIIILTQLAVRYSTSYHVVSIISILILYPHINECTCMLLEEKLSHVKWQFE